MTAWRGTRRRVPMAIGSEVLEMAGTVREAKFDRLFAIFDAGGDGYITQDDFDGLVDRVVSVDHGASNGARAQALRDAADRFWSGVKEHLEVDSSGRISREAFRAGLEEAFLRAGRFEELIRPAAEAWFDLYDADGDGRVSYREYELLQLTARRPAGDVKAGFRAIDVNADGYLTLEEFSGLLHDYYHSDDGDAPGNWLFGPL
jgi:Ca2+-binding EF-hand superfamily protein